VVENLSELNDEEFKLHVRAVADETSRRLTLAAQANRTPVAVENLIGPDEACALLGMKKRTLYRLEKARGLPFARSRSQKDRAYDLAGLLKWRDRQKVA
jgi:excisionase family DNA binding protein